MLKNTPLVQGRRRGGGERGSSGTSRAIPNIVSELIPNASCDPFAHEFNRVVAEDTDPNAPYYRLIDKITYKRIYYNPATQQYSLTEPQTSSPSVENPSVPPAGGDVAPAAEGSVDGQAVAAGSSGAGVQNAPPAAATEGLSTNEQIALIERINDAKQFVDLCKKLNQKVSDEILTLANTNLDPDLEFHEQVNHDLWKKTEIPEYDLHHDHMPADANVKLNDPSSWFDFFGHVTILNSMFQNQINTLH